MSKIQAGTIKRGHIEELHVTELNRLKYLCIVLLTGLMFI